jgi:hypothetical protein
MLPPIHLVFLFKDLRMGIIPSFHFIEHRSDCGVAHENGRRQYLLEFSTPKIGSPQRKAIL